MPTDKPRAKHSVAAHFVNYGHRGNAGVMPENTLASLKSALAAGANAVEIDLRVSGDGVLVAFHDEALVRTTNGAMIFPGREELGVERFSIAELKQLDAGSWKDPIHAGQQVPTLLEVLQTVQGRARLILDVKGAGTAELVAHALEALNYDVRQVIVFAEGAALTDYRTHLPGATLMAISHAPPAIDAAMFDALRAAGVSGFSLNWEALAAQPEFIAAAHEHKMLIHVWTVNDPAQMQAALAAGVDGIGTDYPGVLAELIVHAIEL